MKANRILNAFSSIDPIMQTEADASMHKSHKKASRPRLRYALIAATLVLLVAMIPTLILMAEQRPSTDDYKKITNLAHAKPFNEENFKTSQFQELGGYRHLSHEWFMRSWDWCMEILDTSTVIIGKPSDIDSVLIENGDVCYHIVTLTVNVEENMSDPTSKTTRRAVYACQYEKSEKGKFQITTPASIMGYAYYHDMGAFLTDSASSFFVLDSIEGRTLDIGKTVLDLSEYGDAYMTINAYIKGGNICFRSSDGIFAQMYTFQSELAKRNGTYPSPGTNGVPDFSQIPGSHTLVLNSCFDTSPTYSLPPKDEFIESANEPLHTVLAGKHSAASQTIIRDNELYWLMSTFTLTVKNSTEDYEGPSTTRLLYTHQYKKEDHLYVPITPSVDFGFLLERSGNRFFVLEKITDQTVTIGNVTYQLSDYADYLIVHALDTTEDHVIYSTDSEKYAEEDKIPYEEFGLINYNPKPPVTVTPIIEYPIDLSISIVNAEELPPSKSFDTSAKYSLLPQEDFIREVNEKYSAFAGTIISGTHYLVPDGEIYWHIALIYLQVKQCTDAYNGYDIIKLMSIQPYKKENNQYISIEPKVDNGFRIMHGDCGFYVLEKLTDQRVTIGSKTYTLSDFADYIAVYTFYSDDTFLMYSEDRVNVAIENKLPFSKFGLSARNDLIEVMPVEP